MDHGQSRLTRAIQDRCEFQGFVAVQGPQHVIDVP